MVNFMKTVGELLHSVQKGDVLASLAITYTGEGEDAEGYDKAWDILLTIQPKMTTLSCVLALVERPVNWKGIDVSGLEAGDTETHYAIEFVDWAEWLSMPVIVDPSAGDLSEVEQLVHILYEMTWGGYTPATQQEHLEEIQDRYEETKEMFGDKPLN